MLADNIDDVCIPIIVISRTRFYKVIRKHRNGDACEIRIALRIE